MENKKLLSDLLGKMDNAMDDLVSSAIKGFGSAAGLSVYAVSKKAAELMNKSKDKKKLTDITKKRFEVFFGKLNWNSIYVIEQAELPANLFKTNIAGMTFGHEIYTSYKNSQTTYFPILNLIHELVHVKQVETIGETEFAKKYGQQFVSCGGYSEKMPFEAEAYGFVRNIPFEPFFYMGNNPDINEIVRGKKDEAFLHWLDLGIDQDRQASRNFKPSVYLAKNPDIEAICGKTNYKAAVRHWIEKGAKELRKGI